VGREGRVVGEGEDEQDRPADDRQAAEEAADAGAEAAGGQRGRDDEGRREQELEGEDGQRQSS
jgi:hypothetical protein